MVFDILLHVFIGVIGIALGYSVAILRNAPSKKNTDGTIGVIYGRGQDKPIVQIVSMSPVSKIVEQGYAVFTVDPNLIGIDDSRDI